jgi:hypothetical protein
VNVPLSDENPTLRTPLSFLALLITLVGVWVLIRGEAGAGHREPLPAGLADCE